MIINGLTILGVFLVAIGYFYLGYLEGRKKESQKWDKDLRVMTDRLNETLNKPRGYKYNPNPLDFNN